MRIGIMQPYLFPYIGYFQLMQAVDIFVFYDDVNFIPHGWINRNRILINGEAHLFSVPLMKKSQNILINEVKCDDSKKWRIEFLKKIDRAYRRAPQYDVVREMLQKIILHESILLADLIIFSFKVLNEYLNLNARIFKSSEKYENRHFVSAERIMDICHMENCDEYVNLPGGMKLYDRNEFTAKEITLKFLQPGNISYPQLSNIFVPSLSIIDVLMFNQKERVRDFLNNYNLL